LCKQDYKMDSHCCCVSSCSHGQCQHHLGTHVLLPQLHTLPAEYSRCKHIYPIQTFASTSNNTQNQLVKLIKDYNIEHFTHANYRINLCGTPSKRLNEETAKKTKEGWNSADFYACNNVIKEMEFASSIGSKGVVVHTGAHCGRHNIPVSTDRMEYAVRKILDGSPPTSTLLLETPVGEGSEIVAKIEDLAAFYVRLVPTYGSRIKLCADTCHIWSAGYNVMQYLKAWNEAYPNSIGVIHYNDSLTPQNSHKDRHARFDGRNGKMGPSKMEEIRHWAHSNNIPLIVEDGEE
jgi:endonuclease IV